MRQQNRKILLFPRRDELKRNSDGYYTHVFGGARLSCAIYNIIGSCFSCKSKMAAAKPLNSGYSALTILPSYNSTLCPRTIIAKIIANFTLFYKFYVCTFSALLYVRYIYI